MPYKLTKDDFIFEYPRYDKITRESFMNLGSYVYPGANASGYLKDYSSQKDTYYLFIDEKDASKNVLFLSGVLVEESKIDNLSQFIKFFKNKFRPEIPENKWYLKGEGKWLDKDSNVIISNLEESFTKWVLWANNIDIFQDYTLHASITFKKKIQYKSLNKKEKNIEFYQKAFDSLFLTLMPFKKSKIYIVIDEVQGAQEIALKKSFDSAKKFLNLTNFQIVSKATQNQNYKNGLQFIDMQLYALTRVTFPTNQNNILVGFENYIQEIQNKTIMNTLKEKGTNYIKELEIKYFVLKKLFTHLRYQLLLGQWMAEFPDKTLSSIILNATKTHLNFGVAVSTKIAFLINSHQYEKFNLTKYE